MIIVVPGKPVPQGNHRSNGYRIYETSKGHKQWRALVTQHAAMVLHNSGRLHFVGPVVLVVDFFFLRPSSHLKKDGSLRKGKPIAKVSSPDLSKLVRCVEDALTDAGVGSIKLPPTWDSSVMRRFRSRSARRMSELRISEGESSSLPTPSASNYGSNRGGAAGRTGKVRHSLQSMAKMGILTPGKRGLLSPRFVEWMMMLPIGHTDLSA